MERTIPIDPILEKGYNVRLLVDDFDGLIEKWSNWSEDFQIKCRLITQLSIR